VAWAVFDIKGLPAAVLFADVTGNDAKVDQLRGDIAAAMAKKNIKPTEQQVSGTTLTIYKLPKRGAMESTTLVHFVCNGYFVATQHVELAKQMVPRVGVLQSDNLSGLATYQYVLGECRKASQQAPHATLYLVPFDCLEMTHKVAKSKEVEIDRSPEVYRSQGFDALSAIGATIVFRGPGSDFSFFASLFAPKPWSKSMQMFDLVNGPVALENWIDANVSSCSLLNLRAKSVYGNLGPLFDEVIVDAEGAWDEILSDLRDAEDGPRLDLQKEVLAHLSQPVIILESESLPVTPESPQVLLAIKSPNEPALQAGLKKAMQDDPFILKKEVGATKCYYSVSQNNNKKLLWVMCVAQGYLFMANDFDILTPILQGKVGPPLSQDSAFMRAEASWKSDLAAEASTVTFYHLDRWVEVRHELLRTGKEVSSRKSLSGMLNGFFGGEPIEEGKPELDGTKLPPFAQIRKYFGTFEAAVVTVNQQGWLVSGHVRR